LRRSFSENTRTRGVTNENDRGNVLASGLRLGLLALPSFFPPSSPLSQGLAEWEIVSSYSSATAPESHGVPSHRSLSLKSQRTEPHVEQRAARKGKENRPEFFAHAVALGLPETVPDWMFTILNSKLAAGTRNNDSADTECEALVCEFDILNSKHGVKALVSVLLLQTPSPAAISSGSEILFPHCLPDLQILLRQIGRATRADEVSRNTPTMAAARSFTAA
jgi:hypothetical protein